MTALILTLIKLYITLCLLSLPCLAWAIERTEEREDFD